MFDWRLLFAEAFSVLGLALMLAGWGARAYRQSRAPRPRYPQWTAGLASGEVRLGALLVCLGLAAGSGTLPEQVGWAALGGYIAYGGMRAARAPAPLPAAPGPADLPLPAPPPSVATPGAWPDRLGALLEATLPFWTGLLLVPLLLGQGRYLGAAAFWAVLRLAAARGAPARSLRSPVDGALLLLLLLIPVTLSITVTPALTQEQLGYLLAELIAFHTVVTWATSARRITQVAAGLVGLGAAVGVVAALSVLRGGRLAVPAALLHLLPFTLQDTANKNVIGGALAVLLPLGVGLALGQPWRGPGRARGPLALGGTLLIAGALALSQSRGAYLAAAAALALMAVVAWPLARWAAALVTVLLAGALWQGALLPLAGEILRFDSLGGPEVRVAVWSRALYALHDFPFTGLGLGGFREVVPLLYPYLDAPPGQVIPHAHNIFLQAGVDLGLPGLVAFLAILLGVAAGGAPGWVRWRRAGSRGPAAISLGGLGALAALLVHGQLDAVTWGTKPASLAWAALGLLLATGLAAGPASTAAALRQHAPGPGAAPAETEPR